MLHLVQSVSTSFHGRPCFNIRMMSRILFTRSIAYNGSVFERFHLLVAERVFWFSGIRQFMRVASVSVLTVTLALAAWTRLSRSGSRTGFFARDWTRGSTYCLCRSRRPTG
jgi:hypothetical protein